MYHLWILGSLAQPFFNVSLIKSIICYRETDEDNFAELVDVKYVKDPRLLRPGKNFSQQNAVHIAILRHWRNDGSVIYHNIKFWFLSLIEQGITRPIAMLKSILNNNNIQKKAVYSVLLAKHCI